MPNFVLGREIQHDYNRRFIGLKTWRKIKSNVQTQANRSLLVLCKNFEKDVVKYLTSETGFLKHSLFIREYVTRAYSLGMKASGMGISQAYADLTRYHLIPSIQPFDQQVLQGEIKKAQSIFQNVLNLQKLNSIDELIEQVNILCSLLIGVYNIGRVNGSARYSMIYWISKDDNCSVCTYLSENSPWPKQVLSVVPLLSGCACKHNCSCQLKIIHSNSQSYSQAVMELPDRATLTTILQSIAKDPSKWTFDYKSKALTRIR